MDLQYSLCTYGTHKLNWGRVLLLNHLDDTRKFLNFEERIVCLPILPLIVVSVNENIPSFASFVFCFSFVLSCRLANKIRLRRQII